MMLAILIYGFLLSPAPLFVAPNDVAADMALLETQIGNGTLECSGWREKIALYTQTRELQEARPLVDLLCRHCPEDPVFQEARMIGLAVSGDRQAAVEIGEHLLLSFPDYPTIRINLAHIYSEEGRFAEALNLIVSALERAPLRGSDWGLAMRLVARLETKDQAVLDRLMEKQAQFPQARGLAELILAVQIRRGDYDGAIAWIERNPFLADDPEVASFVRQLKEITRQESP